MTPRWMMVIIAVPTIAIIAYVNAEWFWLPHITPFFNNLEYYFLSDFIFSLVCLAAVGACATRAMQNSRDPKDVFWFGTVILVLALVFFHFLQIQLAGTAAATATSDSLRMFFAAGLVARLFSKASNAKLLTNSIKDKS